MKPNRLGILVLGLAAAMAAQIPADQAVRQVLDAQQAAWNAGNIDAFMLGYWNSPQTQFIGADGITLGWATVRAHYLKSYPSQAAMGRLSFTGVQVEMLGDDAAYVVGHFALQRALDNPVSRPHGVFTLLFRKFPEGWKIVSDHTTAAAKMPAAVPVKAH